MSSSHSILLLFDFFAHFVRNVVYDVRCTMDVTMLHANISEYHHHSRRWKLIFRFSRFKPFSAATTIEIKYIRLFSHKDLSFLSCVDVISSDDLSLATPSVHFLLLLYSYVLFVYNVYCTLSCKRLESPMKKWFFGNVRYSSWKMMCLFEYCFSSKSLISKKLYMFEVDIFPTGFPGISKPTNEQMLQFSITCDEKLIISSITNSKYSIFKKGLRKCPKNHFFRGLCQTFAG